MFFLAPVSNWILGPMTPRIVLGPMNRVHRLAAADGDFGQMNRSGCHWWIGRPIHVALGPVACAGIRPAHYQHFLLYMYKFIYLPRTWLILTRWRHLGWLAVIGPAQLCQPQLQIHNQIIDLKHKICAADASASIHCRFIPFCFAMLDSRAGWIPMIQIELMNVMAGVFGVRWQLSLPSDVIGASNKKRRD